MRTAGVIALALIFIASFAASIAIAQNTSDAQPQNLCEGVTCGDSGTTCPDGAVVSCSNSCDSSTGACSQCTPSCAGHDAPAPPQPETKCEAGRTKCDGNAILACDPAAGFVPAGACPAGERCRDSGNTAFCEREAACGDGICAEGELKSCPADCQQQCPFVDYPLPEFCPDGFVEPKRDDSGCITGYECKERGPQCGDGVCHFDETQESCPADCAGAGPPAACPLSRTCSDGSEVACHQTPGGCECDQCPLPSVPPGCRQEKDEFGHIRVICEQPSCPHVPREAIDKCTQAGGQPQFRKDARSCEVFDCRFVDTGNNPLNPQLCPAKEEVTRALASCEAQGLRGVVSFEGRCEVPRCAPREERRCPLISETEVNELARQCASGGLSVIKVFREGCPLLSCGSPDTCPREPPADFISRCTEEGGELAVRHDASGCVAFAECVRRGDKHEAFFEPPEEVDVAELLSIALRLETLRVEFDKLARETKNIADYYRSTGSSEAERFERVSGMFAAAEDKIGDIKDFIRDRAEDATIDDMTEIKREVRYLKDVMLKDILYMLLSDGDDVREIKEGVRSDCGRDGECFDRAFRVCKPMTFEPEDGVLVTIRGLENSKCVLHAIMEEAPSEGLPPDVSLPLEMTCSIANYALGMRGPEDIIDECSGSMADMFKKYGVDSGGPPGVPGKCSGDECRQYCPSSAEAARECLEHLGPYLPPDTREGLSRIARGESFGFEERREFRGSEGVREEFRSEFREEGGEFRGEFRSETRGEGGEEFRSEFRGTAGEACGGCLDNGVCDANECSFCGDCGG